MTSLKNLKNRTVSGPGSDVPITLNGLVRGVRTGGGHSAPGPVIIISGMVEESLGKVITTKPILAGVVHMGLLIVILNRNN